ncbi:MAG: hypothetical protein V4753_09860 [Pseudomonadota bacterium]
MNLIDLAARERTESELITLSAELHDRCLAGATPDNLPQIIRFARRILDTASDAQT